MKKLRKYAKTVPIWCFLGLVELHPFAGDIALRFRCTLEIVSPPYFLSRVYDDVVVLQCGSIYVCEKKKKMAYIYCIQSVNTRIESHGNKYGGDIESIAQL